MISGPPIRISSNEHFSLVQIYFKESYSEIISICLPGEKYDIRKDSRHCKKVQIPKRILGKELLPVIKTLSLIV